MSLLSERVMQSAQGSAPPCLDWLAPDLQQEIREVTRRALAGEEAALTAFHRLLAQCNRARFSLDGTSSPAEEVRLETLRKGAEFLR